MLVPHHRRTCCDGPSTAGVRGRGGRAGRSARRRRARRGRRRRGRRRSMAALDAAIRDSSGAFVIDLCDVEFLDSSGLSVLMRARALLGREERALAVVCPPGSRATPVRGRRRRRPALPLRVARGGGRGARARRMMRADGSAALRRPGSLLRRDTEAQQSTAEGDGADREPRRAERQTGDHVAQPVHAEQHSASGHHHGEPGRDPDDHRSRAPTAATAEEKRRRREERGRPGRVAARERGPERLGDGVELRPHAIGEVLDRRREDAVPGDDYEQERGDPLAPGSHRLDEREEGGEEATTMGSPRCVMAFSPSVENADACRSPQLATLLSSRTRSLSPRTR